VSVGVGAPSIEAGADTEFALADEVAATAPVAAIVPTAAVVVAVGIVGAEIGGRTEVPIEG